MSKPFDTKDLLNLLNAEAQPLYERWSEIWAVGSQEAIAEANDLIARGAELMGAATQRGKALLTWAQVFTGEQWTKEQLEQWQKELQALGEARRKFGVIARKDTGMDVANLFASNDPKELKSGESPQS